MIVLSDTTPIISLLKIDRLYLLEKLFDEVLIPSAVYQELTSNSRFQAEAKTIRECAFIKTVSVENEELVRSLMIQSGLDQGESEAIICSGEVDADLLLMDEVKGRQVATQKGIRIMGTIGIMIAAYDMRFLSKEDIMHCVTALRETGRHINEKLYVQLMQRIGQQK